MHVNKDIVFYLRLERILISIISEPISVYRKANYLIENSQVPFKFDILKYVNS